MLFECGAPWLQWLLWWWRRANLVVLILDMGHSRKLITICLCCCAPDSETEPQRERNKKRPHTPFFLNCSCCYSTSFPSPLVSSLLIHSTLLPFSSSSTLSTFLPLIHLHKRRNPTLKQQQPQLPSFISFHLHSNKTIP